MYNLRLRRGLMNVLSFTTTLVALGFAIGISAETYAQVTSPSTSTVPAQQRSWTKPDISIDQRVSTLIKEMTLEEKIGQLSQANATAGEVTGTNENAAARGPLSERARRGQLGSVLNDVNPKSINSLQRVAVKESRLGIQLIFGRDVIHGFRTIFPIPLGQAA